jgi:hypothetical protein
MTGVLDTEAASGRAARLEDALAVLAREAGGASARRAPPLHLWNPPDCGLSGIEIRRDGSWWHEGARMTRESLVRLFATILRKEADGATYLVTPVEKMRVRVEDAAFLAVRVDVIEPGADQAVAFTTNMGDVVVAGPDNPIRVEEHEGEPRPYVMVRHGLEARILRAPFYELVDSAAESDGALHIVSQGARFRLGAM